ncbi:T9SS type A sorting domain-containing protein [Cryomorphaceae bacterium 1068]|nr:T9SS type A sorting domain-containing protein [Cryomorphaceae bacterium 1068]
MKVFLTIFSLLFCLCTICSAPEEHYNSHGPNEQLGTCSDPIDLGVQSTNSLCDGTALLNDLWLNPSVLLPPDGVWTLPNGSIVPGGVVSHGTSPSGIYTYNYINAEGCPVTISMWLSISTGPAELFPSNDIEVSLSDPPFAPFDSLLGEPASLGGSWIYFDSWDNLLLFSGIGGATTWTLNPADYFEGNPMVDGYVVYYSNDPACGFSQDTIYIDVLESSSCVVSGGTITRNQPNPVCSDEDQVSFSVTGAQGQNLVWAVFDQSLQNLLATNTTGIFNLPNNTPSGTYKIVHVAYEDDVPLGQVTPTNFPDCFDPSNVLNLVIINCPGISMATFPNPAKEHMTVSMQFVDQEMTSLRLFDNTGRVVKDIFLGIPEVDLDYQFQVDLNGLPPGVYVFKVTTPSEVITEKIILSK